ncbi:MAG: tyrosine-type recombinase/integrase, partial [Methylocystis sp.]
CSENLGIGNDLSSATISQENAEKQVPQLYSETMPCHHNLEAYLHEYIDGAGLATEPKTLLFQTYSRATGQLTGNPLPQANAYAMIQRRAKSAGITTRVGNHTFCATGVTAYLKNGGTLERAAQMANHASTRTTQLYDRRAEEVMLDELERFLV